MNAKTFSICKEYKIDGSFILYEVNEGKKGRIISDIKYHESVIYKNVYYLDVFFEDRTFMVISSYKGIQCINVKTEIGAIKSENDLYICEEEYLEGL